MLPGSARALAFNQDGTANSAESPESRGNVVTVFFTGQGSVDPLVATGEPAPSEPFATPVLPVSATVGGVSATVRFAGLSPGSVGVAQANIELPGGAEAGAEVPLVINVGGQDSNRATIAVQ